MSKKKKNKKVQHPYPSMVKLSPSREEFLANYELKQELVEQAKSDNRGWLERWFDRHNHKMEFMRTLFGLLTLGLQAVIIAKLFGFLEF